MNLRLPGRLHLSTLAPALLIFAAAPVIAADTPVPTAASHTVEVSPGIEVAVEAVALQKNAHGGIARLRVRIDADAKVRDTVVTLRTPDGVVFADGSSVKTWTLEAGAHGSRMVPVEVIAAADGVHLLSAELHGMLGDQPVHRGASYRLAIGVTGGKLPVRGGAIEFAAVADDGGAR